jgi:beta-glucanase (GH16 family)
MRIRRGAIIPVIVVLAGGIGGIVAVLHHGTPVGPLPSPPSSSSAGRAAGVPPAPGGTVGPSAGSTANGSARVSGSAPASAGSSADQPTGRLVFEDEFDGAAGTTPNAAFWHYDTGGNGWGNQQLECDTDGTANAALDGHGFLVVTARYEPGQACADGSVNDYTSARLTTQGLASHQYGQIRVRAQLPSASGLWPAIWGLGTDGPSVGWPQSGEIDVAEVVGQTPDTIYQTLHGPNYNGGAYSIGAQYSIGQPTGAGFHTYGVDWSPQQIAFSVDGAVYATFTRSEVEKQGTWVFDQPFYLMLDLAVGGTFPGSPADNGVFPQQMIVDYIRVYD